MSFSFYVTGSPAAVKAECDKTSPHESVHCIAVKNFVKELLNGVPEDKAVIVSVESGGHHDYGNTHSYQPIGTVNFRFRLVQALPESAAESKGE